MTDSVPRCEIRPEADHRVSFLVDGKLRMQWNYSPSLPRPCLYPVIGPAGAGLTRMGHPGAPNHDHHESVWFAHAKVLGIDFWSNNSDATIRQSSWLAYRESDQLAAMAVQLAWLDGHQPSPLLNQELILVVRPIPGDELWIEMQSTWTPDADELEFQQTNFGFLAVRVAASISEYFGGGRLTDATGRTSESEIFGKRNRWVDYSGPVRNPSGETVINGITYFDHQTNPGFPNGWHVREDGWMGMSPCMFRPLTTRRDSPLSLRFALHIHNQHVVPQRAEEMQALFSRTPPWRCIATDRKHTHRIIEPAS